MKNEQQTSLPEREEPVAATTMRPSQNSKSAERVLNKPQKPFSSYWLQKAVEDAYYLHSYSITTGKKIPDKVSQAIIDLKHLYDQGAEKTIDAAMETRFTSAYRELAATMFPVTVESLRDTEDIQFDARRPFISRVQLSKAQQVLFLLPVVAVLLIFSILGCEIAQSIFIPGLRDITTKEAKIDELRGAVQDNPAVLDQLDDLNNDINALLRNLKATWESFPVFSTFARFGRSGENWLDDADALIIMKTRLAILVEALNRLLPILYGALGATAYLLRVLVPHITSRTFNKTHAGSISVRICLGMLSGIAIQWFLASGQQANIFERSLSTSALAFLAGYSVEFLFSMMDRFIQGVKPAKSSPRSQQEES